MEINFDENKKIWDKFSATSPQGSIFTNSKFLDSLNIKYRLITVYDKGKIVAGAPILFSDSDLPLSQIHEFTQYQGLILAGRSQEHPHSKITHDFKAAEFILSELTKKYKNFSLCQHWRYKDLRSFQWLNYHEIDKGVINLELRYTGILDLEKYENFEFYLKSIRSVRRQEYKKALKNLKTEAIGDSEILDMLHKRTFDRQGITRQNDQPDLLKSITEMALKSGYGKLTVAQLDNKPISSILFLYDHKTAYYLFGATDPEARNSFGNTLLLLEMIKDAFARGFKEIDFVGVNSPNRGDYKISFNAELKPFFIATYQAK